jgi:hypothetical protein
MTKYPVTMIIIVRLYIYCVYEWTDERACIENADIGLEKTMQEELSVHASRLSGVHK